MIPSLDICLTLIDISAHGSRNVSSMDTGTFSIDLFVLIYFCKNHEQISSKSQICFSCLAQCRYEIFCKYPVEAVYTPYVESVTIYDRPESPWDLEPVWPYMAGKMSGEERGERGTLPG